VKAAIPRLLIEHFTRGCGFAASVFLAQGGKREDSISQVAVNVVWLVTFLRVVLFAEEASQVIASRRPLRCSSMTMLVVLKVGIRSFTSNHPMFYALHSDLPQKSHFQPTTNAMMRRTLFAKRQPLCQRACRCTQTLLQMPPPRMSKSFSIYNSWNGTKQGVVVHGGQAWTTFTENNPVQMQKRSLGSAQAAIDYVCSDPFVLIFPSVCLWVYGAPEILMWYHRTRSYADVKDASLKSDIQESTRQALASASVLRVTVEDRRLSLDMSGKSAPELQRQLDSCKERICEVYKEREELEALQRQTQASIQTFESLMRKPGVSFWEKLKIRSKRAELHRLKSKCKKRDRQLLNLVCCKLWDERDTIQDQLKQQESKK
jgi:hypothetical protein